MVFNITFKQVMRVALFSALIFGGASVYYKQLALEKKLAAIVGSADSLATNIDVSQSHVVEKLVSNNQLWRPIQAKAKDSVVQVFSQIAEFDMMQPYKTPGQYSAYGTGFFINAEGDIITNAHVIDQARAVWIQIPSLGKQIVDAEVVSMSPERDIALLRVKPQDREMIKRTLGAISFLPLGDSDMVRRSDDVMALGYPLGQQSLKSTTGVISGREQQYIQMSAAINPGNSGGPLLNTNGEVIGINSAGVPGAQNVGYIIPINDLKIVLPDLYKVTLLRKPFLGVLFNNATETLTEYLGNPNPGGCYVVEVVPGSTLDKAGVKRGDMIYEIDGHHLDIFGEMVAPWSEDKISLMDYVNRLSVGQEVQLVVYREGERKEITMQFSQSTLPAIRRVYPGFEDIDYEVFGGMVVMELTINHIQILASAASGLTKYAEMKNQGGAALIITHIFPNSQLYRSRALAVGSTINEINDRPVHTLADFRKVIKDNAKEKFLTIRASDNVVRASDNVLVTLEMQRILQEEPQLAMDFKYPISAITRDLLKNNSVAVPVMAAKMTQKAKVA